MVVVYHLLRCQNMIHKLMFSKKSEYKQQIIKVVLEYHPPLPRSHLTVSSTNNSSAYSSAYLIVCLV